MINPRATGLPCLALVTLSVLLATSARAANTARTVNTNATDLSLTTSYSNSALPSTTTDMEFTGSYGSGTITFNLNTGALTPGTLDDADTTQSLVISETGSATGTITLSTAANSLSGTAADLLWVKSGANLTIQQGTGTLTLKTAVTGNIDNAGTLSIAAPLSIGTGTVLSFTGAGATTVGGNIANTTGAVTINDAGGSVTFSGTESYTGATTITAGTLQLNGSLASGSAVSVATAGTLSGSGTVNGNATLTGSGIINFTNPGNIAGTLGVTGGNWNGAGTVGGQVTSSSGTFTIGSGANLTATTGVNVTGGNIVAGNSSSTITGNVNYTSTTGSTFAGVIAGTNNTLTLNIAGTTLILSGTNTYTGATSITAGTLQVTGSLASGSTVGVATAGTLSGTGTVNGNATLTGSGIINFTNPGNIVGTLGVTGGNWNGAGTVGGQVTSSSGTFTIGSSANLTATTGVSVTGGTLAGTGTVTGNATLTGSGIINFTNPGNITGTLGVTGGNWNGAGTVAGQVTSSSGTFTIGTGANLTATTGLNVTGGSIASGSGTSTITGNVNYTSSTDSTFGGVIAGASKTLTMNSGGATLTLGGTNTYTGATTVTAGTLQVNGSLASGSTVGVATAGTLSGTGTINGNTTLTGSGIISFTSGGNIVGTLGVTGGNWNGVGTVTGLITSSSGTFTIGSGDSLTANGGLSVTGGSIANGSSTSTITIASAKTLNYTSSTGSTFGGVIAGSGGVTMNSSGVTLALGGANTYTGLLTISGGGIVNAATAGIDGSSTTNGITFSSGGGTLQAATGGISTAKAVTLTSAGMFDTNGNNSTLSGAITGAGLFTKLGTGTLTLTTGTNTFNGGLTIGAGTVLVGTGTSVGASTVTIGSTNNSATLDLNGQTETIIGLATSGTPANQTITNSSASSDAVLSYTGATTSIFGGLIQNGSTHKVGLTVNNASANLALTGANTYSGATQLTNGILQLQNTGSIASSALTLSGGTLQLRNDTNNTTFSDASTTINGNTAIDVDDASAGTLGNTLKLGNIGMAGNTVTFTNSAGDVSYNLAVGTVTASAGPTFTNNMVNGTTTINALTLTPASTQTAIFNGTSATANTSVGAITQNGANALAVTQSGSGALTLTGNNTFTGGVTITGGQLNINSASALGTAAGTFTIGPLTGSSETIDNTSSGGAITVTPANPVTINDDFTFGGSNNLTLGGAVSLVYGSTTTSNSETITVNGSTLTFSGAVTSVSIHASETLNVNGPGNLVFGSFVLNARGNQETNFFGGTGKLTISGIVSTGGNSTDPVTYNGSGSLILNGANTYGGLTTVSSGTLTLAGDNTSATGGVTVSGGQLNINSPTALGGSSATFTISSGTIDNTNSSFTTSETTNNPQAWNGNFTFVGSNNLNLGTGAVTLGNTTTQVTVSATTLAVGGVISGSGDGITKAGSGTLALTNANTYTGVTKIDAGILNSATFAAVNTASGIGKGSSGGSAADLVFGGGTLQYTGTSAAATTNRLFTIGDTNGNSATLDSSSPTAADTLSFTGAGSIAFTNAVTHSLILTGSNTGNGVNNNTFAPIIGDQTATTHPTSLTKNGGGNWFLTGANTYSGVTTIDGGILNVATLAAVNTTSSIGKGSTAGSAADLVLNGGTLQYTGTTAAATTNRLFTIGDASSGSNSATLDSSSTTSADTLSFTGAGSLAFANTAAHTLTLTGSNTGNNTLTSIIGNQSLGNATSLTKSGSGTWLLNGADTYTGVTTISGGTLKLSTTGNNNIAGSSQIIVGDTLADNSAILNVSGVTGTGGFKVASGQTLAGYGTVTGATVELQSGATLSPGNSIGTLSFGNNLTLDSSSTSNFQLGTPGTLSALGTNDLAAVTGTLALGGTLNLFDNAGANSQGSYGPGAYQILTYTSTDSGSFSSIVAPAGTTGTLHLKEVDLGAGTAAGKGINLEVFRLASANTLTPTTIAFNNFRVGAAPAGQTVTVQNMATNDGFSEKLDAAATTTGGATVSGSPISLLATGSSSNLSIGVSGATAGSQNGTVVVALNSDGTGTSGFGLSSLGSQTINVTGAAYDYANALYTGGTLNFGILHQGATVSSQTVAFGNKTVTNASYQDLLNVSATTLNTNVTATGFTGLGASTNGTTTNNLTVAVSTATAGSLASTENLSLVSNHNNVSGLTDGTATVVGTPGAITTTGQVYSGASTWNTNGSGSWGTLAGTVNELFGKNWGATQGSPGLDSNFKGVDTASFGPVTGSPVAASTVSLNAAAPNLNSITFSSPSTSYTLAQQNDGISANSITLSKGTGAPLPSINVTGNATAGTQTISAPIVLAANTSLNVGLKQTLTVSGAISGSGYSVGNTGPGATILSSATGNSYSGGTTVSGGTLYVNSGVSGTSSGTGTGAVTVNNGGTLAGSGNITTSAGVTINNGGTLSSGPAQTGAPGVVTGHGLTFTNTSVTLNGDAPANLTFSLGTDNTSSSPQPYGFAHPSTNSTYMTLAGSSTLNFEGIESVSLVDLTAPTSTTGANLTLRQGTPYLLVAAGSDSAYTGLITVAGAGASAVYSLDGDGYVVGVLASGSTYVGGTTAPILNTDYTPIAISQFGTDGVTPLASNDIYPDPVLYLNHGDLEVVPEPGTWALMLGGLLVLVLIQRHRRQQESRPTVARSANSSKYGPFTKRANL